MLTLNQEHELAKHLWHTHEKAISRALFSYEADKSLREDLAQEVFIALVQSAKNLKCAENQKAYVFRIVHNVAVDHIAKQAKQKAYTTEPAELSDLVDVKVSNEQLTLDEQVQASQQQQLLLEAVRNLKLPYRQVMILVLEDLNSEEIADILKMNSGAVRVRINRAKIELKEALAHVIGR